MLQKNPFGAADVVCGSDLDGTIYITSAACMTLFAETLGWANANTKKISCGPGIADNIMVLSCQVTDLSILNDINLIERLQDSYPGKRYFIGGCLAQRFDIKLSKGVERLEHLRADYQELTHMDLINYEPPFWVNNFADKDAEFDDGHLFRNMYPIRGSVGCHGKCEFCTIRVTRGKAYELDPQRLTHEFITHDDILIVADSLSTLQISDFAMMAVKHNKKISMRNIEPHNLYASMGAITTLAKRGLLKVLHSPVQSMSPAVLKDMNRNVHDVDFVMRFMKEMKSMGVFIATNIITDYKNFPNDFKEIYELFDYVSWNPYWDGVWDRGKAEDRWKYYFGSDHNVKR